MGRRVFRKVLGKCLSRLETSRATPPLFLQFYFLKRLISSEISSESRIMLRKAFCGNGFIHLNIHVFWRSGLKMGDFDHRPRLLCNFLKKRSESKLSAFVFLVGWRRLGFCRACVAPIDSSGKGPVGIAFLALQFEPCSPSIRSADIADDAELSTARTSRRFAGQDSWLPLQIWPFSAFLAEQHSGPRSSMV